MTEHGASLSVGEVAPAFELPEIGPGGIRSSKEYLGRPAIFFMWASW